jgi:hypothetical protein
LDVARCIDDANVGSPHVVSCLRDTKARCHRLYDACHRVAAFSYRTSYEMTMPTGDFARGAVGRYLTPWPTLSASFDLITGREIKSGLRGLLTVFKGVETS